MGRKNNLTSPNKAWGDNGYSNKKGTSQTSSIEPPKDVLNKTEIENPYSFQVDAKEFSESMKPMIAKILHESEILKKKKDIKTPQQHQQILRILTIVTIGSLLCSFMMAIICLSTCRSISKLVKLIAEK
jgi:hypothetical protein